MNPVELCVYFIPLIFITLCMVSLFIYGIIHRPQLNYYLWGIPACLISLLIIVLNQRGQTESGFAAPIIMGLILVGFFCFMAILTITKHNHTRNKEQC